FRDSELEVTPGAVTLILKAIDRIRHILSAMEQTGAEPAGEDSVLIAEINAVASGQTATADTEPGVDSPSLDDEGGFPVAAELLAEVAQAIEQNPALAAPSAKPEVKKVEAAKAAGETPVPATDPTS